MNDNDLDIAGVGEIYASANVPSYFIRRVKELPEIYYASKRLSSSDILKRLIQSAEGLDPSLSDERRLLCLVLLGLKNDVNALRVASKLPIQGRWYRTVVDTLLQTSTPTNINMIMPRHFQSRTRPEPENTTTSIQLITVGGKNAP